MGNKESKGGGSESQDMSAALGPSPDPVQSEAVPEAEPQGEDLTTSGLAATLICEPPSEEAAALLKKDGKVMLRMAPPGCTQLSDVLIVLLYHMLPFTPLPIIGLVNLAWHLYSVHGWYGAASFITVFLILTTAPLVYNRRFRDRLMFLYLAMARYMKDVKFIVPARKLKSEGPYIFAFHPHGRMFYSNSMMIQTHPLWRSPFLPVDPDSESGDFLGAAASGFFAVPLLRHLLFAIGAMPASKGNIVSQLRKKNNVAIIVGGVKEVCLGTSPNLDALYLKNRKGFIRIAVEEQLGVIPIYCFNENQLFRHDPPWLLKFWEGVNKYVNVGVPFMRGILNLPMPYRRDLLIVVGTPLAPKEGESVDEFHGRYVSALEDLFHRYVHLSPHPQHKLVIT